MSHLSSPTTFGAHSSSSLPFSSVRAASPHTPARMAYSAYEAGGHERRYVQRQQQQQQQQQQYDPYAAQTHQQGTLSASMLGSPYAAAAASSSLASAAASSSASAAHAALALHTAASAAASAPSFSSSPSVVPSPSSFASALRILIPGSVAGLARAGFLTLCIPWARADHTTIGRLKAQVLRSIVRKKGRREIEDPSLLTHGYAPPTLLTPGLGQPPLAELSVLSAGPESSGDLSDHRLFGLVRLSASAAATEAEGGDDVDLGADSSVIPNETILGSIQDWRSMALMLVRLDPQQLERGTAAAVKKVQRAIAELDWNQSGQGQQSQSQQPKPLDSPQWSMPTTAASIYPPPSALSPLPPHSPLHQNHFQLHAHMNGGGGGGGVDSFDAALRAERESMRPMLSSSALDVCICAVNGGYVRPVMDHRPVYHAAAATGAYGHSSAHSRTPISPQASWPLEAAPIGPGSNWACFDAVLPRDVFALASGGAQQQQQSLQSYTYDHAGSNSIAAATAAAPRFSGIL